MSRARFGGRSQAGITVRRGVRQSVAAALVIAASIALLWAFGAFLPEWTTWEEKTFDISGGSKAAGDSGDPAQAGGCLVTLKNRKLTVKRGDETLFSSPLLWFVSDALSADMTGDGQPELILIVWKHGRYGKARPTWVKHDSPAFSQHIFIYQTGEDITPIWMSSEVPHPIASAEIDSDNHLHLTDPPGKETVWAWDSWGLKLFTGPSPESDSAVGSSSDADSARDEASADSSDAADSLTLIAVGDNLAHDSVCKQAFDSASKTYDFTPVYEHAASKISSFDLAVVNQETILMHNPANPGVFPNFETPEEIGDALADAGFDIVLGATNHALDMGTEGLSDTLSFWSSQHPEVTLLGLHDSAADSDQIDYIEKNGVRLALFNYTEHLNGRDLPEDESWRIDVLRNGNADGDASAGDDASAAPDKLISNLMTAEAEADLSICFLHVGEEYASEPTQYVRALCVQLIDAGADVIICTHPHVLQPVETVRTESGASGIVYYSLGNFMSHQRKPETVLGGAAVIRIVKPRSDSAASGNAGGAGTSPGAADMSAGARVAEHRLLGTVCHFAYGTTQVRFLDDYTEELAAEHFLNREETHFTLKSLKEDFTNVLSRSDCDP